jgi:hypothetical protein
MFFVAFVSDISWHLLAQEPPLSYRRRIYSIHYTWFYRCSPPRCRVCHSRCWHFHGHCDGYRQSRFSQQNGRLCRPGDERSVSLFLLLHCSNYIQVLRKITRSTSPINAQKSVTSSTKSFVSFFLHLQN